MKLRSEIYNSGYHNIYNDDINIDLLNILNTLYTDDNDTDPFDLLKSIYSNLANLVQDDDYYNLDYANDNDDLIHIIYAYCNEYEVDKSMLAITLGKLCLPDVVFDSYSDLHSVIVDSLKHSITINDYDDSVNVLLELNDIVTTEINNYYQPAVDLLLFGKQPL